MAVTFGRGRWLSGAILALLLATPLRSQEAPQANPPQPEAPQATEAAPSPPAKADEGTLLVKLAGNRQFCVQRNELAISDRGKTREQRNTPAITTMGYKYQFSVSRRGGSGVVKLLESPTIRTTYFEEPKKGNELPQPRLPTQQEMKHPQQKFGSKKMPRWIAQNTCTTLLPEYRFPLAPGRYDVYLGFDLLAVNGQWVPLESDFVTNLTVEAGKTSRVDGRVDYAAGVRTVKLNTSTKTETPGTR